MMPQLNIQIDEDLFNLIDPPNQYPPTLQYFMQQNDAYFIKQCRSFLQQQSDAYNVSLKIQQNLRKILKSNQQLQSMVLKKDLNSDKIFKQLQKLNLNKKVLQKRQKTLQMICDLIKLEKLKSMLLLEKQKSMSQQMLLKMKKKSSLQSNKSIPSETQIISKPISEQQKRQYLQNLMKIFDVVKQSSILQEFIDNGNNSPNKTTDHHFPLIESILSELVQLFSNAIDKALSPEMLTPEMIKLILSQFYEPFLFDKKLYIRSKKTPKQKFRQIMTNNRVQKYRLQLNPIINNLNYANNVIDLYDSILQTWVRIIDQDLKLFFTSKQIYIVNQATKMILNEALPKLQKNTYKMKQMRQICYIRFKINQFLNKLNSIEILQGSNDQTNKQQKWQPLPSMIQKMKILLEAKIIQESQNLSNAKYNIYSLTSYVPIREYLQAIKQCIEYDFQRPPDLQYAEQQSQIEEQGQQTNQRSPRSPKSKKANQSDNKSHKYLDWELPFYNLAISRKPQSQPNNKSLVIFNLNIWYLYLKIVKQPSHRIIAVQTMLWCKQKFIQMNIKQCLKVYYQSMDKILQMCGNLPVFRNTLYAQITMLGHQDLRKQIAEGIKQKFLVKYSEMLVKVGKQKMNNEEVKIFCKQNKINLNKFGKFSSQICIYSVQELAELIAYN